MSNLLRRGRASRSRLEHLPRDHDCEVQRPCLFLEDNLLLKLASVMNLFTANNMQ